MGINGRYARYSWSLSGTEGIVNMTFLNRHKAARDGRNRRQTLTASDSTKRFYQGLFNLHVVGEDTLVNVVVSWCEERTILPILPLLRDRAEREKERDSIEDVLHGQSAKGGPDTDVYFPTAS